MLLRAIIDVVALLVVFALGVIFGPAVKAALGLFEEDLHVEMGLMRSDVTKMVEGIEQRLKNIETRLER
ncbi:MAG TPA: hypothetical protein VKV28_06100 [Candidatus Binataceae bacterium]|nr:hypothetical protein [Candidatus Binataceae bacterium]